ncbi:MAG: hypothetical protein ACK4R6_12810 [Spirosomataceae bacterium]
MKTSNLSSKSTKRVLIALFLIALIVYAEFLNSLGTPRISTYGMYLGFVFIYARMKKLSQGKSSIQQKSMTKATFFIFILILYSMYEVTSWNEKLPEIPFWLR